MASAGTGASINVHVFGGDFMAGPRFTGLATFMRAPYQEDRHGQVPRRRRSRRCLGVQRRFHLESSADAV